MLRVYLEHESHHRVLVNGDAGIADVNDSRGGWLANRKNVTSVTTPAQWIYDGCASSKTYDGAQDRALEDVLSNSRSGREKAPVAPDRAKREQAEAGISVVFRRQWFTMAPW